VSELRLYLQRDGLHDGLACPWVLLDREGRIERSGSSLEDAPRAGICRAVIEADRVALVETELPDLPERKLTPLLANAVEAATLDEPEQLHVVITGRSQSGKACCATVSAPWLERMLHKLAEREIYPDAAVPEGLLLPIQPGVLSVLANEGNNVLRLDTPRALLIDAGDPPVGLQLALVGENAPQRIRVYQGNCLRMPDLQVWSAALGVEVEAAGKWDWRRAAWLDSANLLTGRLAARRAGMDWKSLLRPLLWGGIALALIQVVGIGLDGWLLQRENKALLAEQRKLAQRVMPAQANIVEPAWQVTEVLARLQSSQGQGDASGMLPLMAKLGGIWPAASAPTLQAVTYSDGTLDIALAGKPTAWVAQLQAGAAGAGLEVSSGEANGTATLVKVRTASLGAARGQ
jgi:type II secretion system protein L